MKMKMEKKQTNTSNKRKNVEKKEYENNKLSEKQHKINRRNEQNAHLSQLFMFIRPFVWRISKS